MFAGIDAVWHRPLLLGDQFTTKAWLKELVEHQTRFAGRAIQQIYRCEFYNQRGDLASEGDSFIALLIIIKDIFLRSRTSISGLVIQPARFSCLDGFRPLRCYPLHMPFTSESARSGRAKALGRKRAAYSGSLGFPNLLKAREVSARNRRARKQARLFAEAKLRNPFALEKTPRGFYPTGVQRPEASARFAARFAQVFWREEGECVG